jgi:ABC-type branched-subunit amino acid transport system substrate-binding protein
MRIIAGVAVFGALAGAAHADEPGLTATEIRIGEILPLTGPVSFAGEAHYLGTKVALAEANASGGAAGRKIVAVTEDDGYVPARSFQAAQKLLADGVFAITGTSGTSHLNAMLPMFVEQKVLTLVTINPAEQAYNPVKKNVFVIGTDYGNAIHAGVKYAVEKLGKKDARFGLIYQDDDFGANNKLGYERAVKEFGLKSVVEIPYKRGQKDFSAEMLRVQKEKVDFLVSGGIIAENVAIFKEAKKLGMTDLRVSTVWTAHLPIVQQLAGEAGDGYYTADYMADLSDPEAAPFVEAAKKFLTADEMKKVNRYTMASYSGASILIQSIRSCEKNLTRDCVIAELESGKKFSVNGATAPFGFSPTKHFSDSPVSVMVSDTKNARFVRAP